MKTLALAVPALFFAGSLSAATTGFSIDFSGSTNVPTVTVENTGDTGSISGLTLTIGDLSRNFDFARDEVVSTPTLTFTLDPSLDALNNGIRSDSVIYAFTGFGTGETFSFRTDVDGDDGTFIQDYRSAVLAGGNVAVTFTGGTTSSLEIDFASTDVTSTSFSFSNSFTEIAPVPLPAGLPLLLAGMGGLALLRRRKS